MSTARHPGGASLRWITRAAAVGLVATTSTACFGTWGLRASYRQYVAGPIAAGEITTEAGATWLDGTPPAQGPFQWTVDHATLDTVAETGTIEFDGGVHTRGHATADGWVLDSSFWNPRLELDGDEGTLYVDLNYRPFEGTTPGELPALQAALDVPFATVDLSGFDWTPDANNAISIDEAPMVGITAAMELIGWDDFYGDPVTLDPLSVSVDLDVFAPSVASTPSIVVSQTTDLHPGDTIIVWGEGFDPTANPGTRPPLSGQPAGAYAVFGRFADTWQPSAGAPSSSRTVLAQRWALGAASRAVLDPSGTNASFVTIDATGRFEATLTVVEGGAAGTYGVYTYPGSGAVNAAYELSLPITFAPAS